VANLLSKRDQMLHVLQDGLRSGRYAPGARLPTEAELSARYGISKNTIREAVATLVTAGQLTRIQGKGTFVRAPAQPPRPVRRCALFVQAQGHVYDPQAKALVCELQQRGIVPLMFDLHDLLRQPAAHLAEAALATVLDQGVDAIITDHEPRWIPDYCLRQATPCPRLVLINHLPIAPAPGVAVIAPDYQLGVALATRHLVALGHDRVLLVLHRNRYARPDQPLEQGRGEYHDYVRGYHDGLGRRRTPRYLLLDTEFAAAGDRDALRKALTARHRPTAVCAVGDYRAKCVIDVARELGLRCPQDLAVTGFYNTPWADHVAVPLTSVSIAEEEIARLAVQTLAHELPAERQQQQPLIVPPRLVLRQSCGATPNR
jgi:DNA-binding LacI/PurR family transcriptional regulator